MQGMQKDMHMRKTLFLQEIGGMEPAAPKRYRNLKEKLKKITECYSSSEILVYLCSIAHISHF